jgi:alkanesulfonate monooxygenase SsuD/methylene tetrahydromethanopterin reductase-like flavin-dependent oxidoreductase (luciferase family)
LVENGTAPTFGLWYDFRQRLPLGDYARFYAECLEEIEEGERLGFTGAWLSEHHFVDDGYLPSPLAVAAATAARTKTMTVGTNVLLLPMHPTLRVAEDAAVVDLISGGRLVLGVGQGYVQHEFETLGFERKYRPSLFEEGIEVIRHAFEGGRTEDLPWERYLVGTPEEVAEAFIELYQEAPYDHFCFWGRLPGVIHEQALANMRLFASRVAPRVRNAVTA